MRIFPVIIPLLIVVVVVAGGSYKIAELGYDRWLDRCLAADARSVGRLEEKAAGPPQKMQARWENGKLVVEPAPAEAAGGGGGMAVRVREQ